MKNGGMRGAVFGAVLFAAAAGLASAENYRVVNGPKDLYFGHISYIEKTPAGFDPLVLRPGLARPERGVVNLPIGPGDMVRTSGDRRCEIQFDTGTIVRLDFSTELRVETIMARSLSSLEAMSVLTLERGRVYVMYKEYDRKEMFQVLTPNAAVKMKHHSVVTVAASPDGTTDAQVRYGRAQVLFGPAEQRLEDRAVKKGERLIVLADHQSELAAAIEDTAFELWNKEINARFEELHEGLTAIPKPIQKLSPAVFHFAQAYGNRYGEWLWDDLYGYVWRPFIDNGAYPWGWSPYYYGRWSHVGGQMFWVPDEPWGWVPYHLGIWQWDKKRGWVWLPGSMFAPAWVTWDFYFGYACWRPWSVFDWMFGDRIAAFRYLQNGWGYDWPCGTDEAAGLPARAYTRTVVHKDSLKQPSGSLPIPDGLKGTLKRVTAAYESGDARAREGAAAVPRQLVFVPKGELTARAIHEKALTWDEVVKPGAPSTAEDAAAPRLADPRREAARIFRGVDGPAEAPRRVPAPGASPARRDAATAAPAGPSVRADAPVTTPGRAVTPARFRDWNPDVRIARKLGVHIEYASGRNEIRCPELQITSRDRDRDGGRMPRMTPAGASFGSAFSVGGQHDGVSSPAGPSGTAGLSSTPPSRGQSDRTSTSSGHREVRGGSETEKIKN